MGLVLKANSSLPINNNNNKVKILHITDTHLFAKDNDVLLGINTNASFCSVINEIKQQPCDFDLIVATGDFVQDGSDAAYYRFTHEIKQFAIPCVWLPGNHDVYDTMKSVFEKQNMPERKVILCGEKWLIVMLNSQVPGKAYGLLGDNELAFLTETLNQYPSRHVMVFLHHHPVLSNCCWLDQHCLKNRVEFGNLVAQYQNIKSIAWGHIHQNFESTWQQCKVFSTPSTCVQFKPSCHEFSLANDSPGWRIIELYPNGIVDSTVHGLNENAFIPDMTVNGY